MPAKELGSCGCGGGCQRPRRRRGRRRRQQPDDTVRPRGLCSGRTPQANWKSFKKWPMVEMHVKLKRQQHPNTPLSPVHHGRSWRVDTQRLLLLIVLSGCVVLGLWGSVTVKVAAKTATDAVGPHYRFLISATGRQPTMTMRRNQHIYPSVLLPKYGLVRGLRFDWSPRDPSGNHDPDTGHHHQQQQQAETVAAFLGVPYAAPPSGPLRFMPPGAARPIGQRAQNELQCSVMPTVDSSAAATISSRPFVEFGHECVQLADWLTTKSAPPPVASQDEPTDDASGTRWPPAATGQRRQAARRQEQSEDCLNLNVFVPLEPNKNNNNNNSNSNSSKPAQLRHHSNIDHQQQPAANTRPTPVAVAQRIKKNSNQLENDDDYKDESGERTNEAAPSEPHEQLVDLANQTTSQSVPRRRRRTTVAAGNNDNDSIWAQAHDQTNTRTTTATTTTILTDATNNNNQLKPICHLQPIINNDPTGEPASGIGVGRDDKPQPSMRAHQQSANRRRLPVIVVFHSSSKLSEAGRVDSGAGQNGPPAQEPESASAPVPQFQSGNAGDSSAPTMARDDGRLAANSETETGSGGGISVIANNSRNSLPPPPSKDNENNKANSFAHLELARRTKSIVITFNYRIGLLGYLPYVDLEDQQLGTGASGPGPFQSSHTRSNHAIWDQIGLLHWIKHNVAHFGGDQANVSLLSGDPGAVQTLQLLALSPQARGLFKRLILVHDDLSMTQQSGGSSSQLDNHFGRLFGLAQTAKHLHRKLVSELGLILERDQLLNEAGGVSGTGASANEDGPQDNFEIDRRVSRFLKSAKLDQLARAEHELAKVSVSLHQQHHHQTASRHSLTDSRDNLGSRQRSSPATTRLIDVIREPNLDDKLLFPYFAHLIKMNRSLESTADGDGSGGELGQTAGRRSPMDHSSIGFWPALAASLDEHQQQQSDNSTTPSSLQTVQLESEYCRYMQHLYAQMFSNRSDTMELDSGSLMSVLKRLDPYKLIPRVSDHQPVTMMSLVSPSSLASSLTTRLDGSNGQGAGDRGQAAARSPNQQLSSKHFIKWKQRNRTANALEFYHLRHAHLLQQILVQNLDKIKNSSATNSNILVRYGGNRTISPLDELKHRNDIDEHGGSDDRVETDREEAYEEADEEEEEDEDEEDGQLLTRLQRQQQRSIMMMQQQQLGQESAGYSRNKRNSLTDVHAAGLSQQLVELLGSFDLLIAFRGEPLVDSGHFASWPGGQSVPYPSPSTLPDEPSLALVSLGSRFTLSEPLVSYLQMADLHHLAATRSAPRHLNNLCEFTGYHQRQSSGAASGWLREPRLEGPRSSYVMVTDWRRRRRGSIRQRRPSSSSGWPTAHQHIQSKDQQQQQQKQQHTAPNDEEPLIGKIAEFAATGKLSGANQNQNQNLEDSKNERSAELVRPYDTLNRELVLIAGDTTTVRAGSSNSYNEQALIRNLIRVRLDLVPYLKRLLEVTNSRRATSGQNLATKHDHHHEHLLEHPLMPPVDLISCVSELNSILNQSTWDKLDDESGGHRHQKLHLMFDNSSLVRFEEEAPCLLNATNKLRLQLRAGAAEELDPLIRQYFIMIEQRQKKQQLNMTNTNKSADSNNQATLALNNEKQLTHHGQRVSSMTTRNLVNQSEGLYLDQLSSSSASSSAALDQLGHHLEREQATSSDGANNGADQRLFAPFGPDNAQATTSTSLPASSNGGGGIRGFFAKTYKDAVGQALGIVVGTGLLIFLLNLAIVLVIAFRSRRNLRRGGEGTNLSTGSCSITNRQSVRDSSSASSNPMPLTIDEDDLEHGLKTMDSTMNGAELGVGACNQQKHFYNQTSLEMNGCSMDMMRPHVGASGGGEGGRHLVSSFETNNFDQIEQEQQQLQQLQSIQTRSSLSSNSQRANKSIKFDLSGAHDKSLSKTSLGGGGHCQRGIMKQPVNTSDEDELQMIETQIGCAHQHNNHQHHHHHHELDNNQISRIEHVTDRYSQQQQLTAVSPVSLDVLDLIPLDGLGYYADAQELAELASSGDDLAVGSQKLVAHSTGARSCQLQAYSNHRHDHHNHHHHHHQQQQQHPIHTQSLGSSSLTSPFASQSTHSTISASNNGHTQNNMNNLNGRGEFSPKRNRMQQQQQHLTFYTGLGIGTLNSPTSSTTLSSAPTPILLTHQHYGAQKPVLIASSRDQTGSLYQQFDQEEPRPQTNNQVISLIYNGGDGIMGAQRGRVMLHDQDKIALEQQQQQQQWQHLEN